MKRESGSPGSEVRSFKLEVRMRSLTIARSLALAGALAAAPGTDVAAQVAAAIDPGMTRAQVVERLGRPTGERTAGTYTYLFYRNGCERECGTPDLVVLRDDGVVDAIFRSATRRYSGTSSSPATSAPMRSPDTEATATEGISERRIPAGGRGGIVTGNAPAGAAARDDTPTPGLSVRARRPVAAPDTAAPAALPERMNPRDSLSPRIDERATHETHAADRQQERGTPPPTPRGLTAAPLSPPAPGVPAPTVTGVRPNPQDSIRAARQRAAQRAGQAPPRPDTSRRDTATTRPPTD